ncbi:hypothetical protein O3P69_020746 [Scylla paramamosain]|uniref:Rotatin N-terminal domain-containing protein n=1 Tax=Scylla paramamosain TaxID=85552 RepID=A0AAW0TRK3_SCYPA
MADISDYIRKLAHPIVEIRTRALHCLLQKVELGLVSLAELSNTHSTLVPHLLKLLHLGPPSATPQVLTLLLFLAEDEGCRARLAGPGVRQQLRELHAVAPVGLLPQVALLLKKLGHASQSTVDSEARLAAAVAPETPDSSPPHSLLIPDSQCFGDEECTEVGAGEENMCDWTTVEDSHDVAAGVRESPLQFVIFPWQALTGSDQHVLESSAQSLMSSNTAEVKASLLFLDTVVLRDFPAEVLLQRPAVLQVVYGCLMEQGEDAWHLQVPACDFLHSLTQLLTSRVNHFLDPHTRPGTGEVVSATSSGVNSPSNQTRISCCSPHSQTAAHLDPQLQDPLGESGQPQPFSGVGQELLGSTVHEQDDGDEFILLGLHQVTVPGHCLRVMKAACPFLASQRPSLQSASLRLMTSSVALLHNCVIPDLLWKLEEEGEGEGEPLIPEVITGVQMVIASLSDLILSSLEARKVTGGERWVLIVHCCSILLHHVLTTLVPVEAAAQVLDDAVCEAVVMVLCEGGFFLQHPQQHHSLLQYLTQANATAADEVRCLVFAAKSLQATSSFLQASDSDIKAFLDLAEKALPSCSVLQDAAFLERLLQGVGRQAVQNSISDKLLDKSRFMVLQILHSPILSVRLKGYKSILGLAEHSIGAAQTLDTSCSRSPAALLLLSPGIIRFLLFAGCADENKEVAKLSRETLLTLLLGQRFMTAAVWTVAAECWYACLPDLQCMADPSSSLGRAIDQIFEAVYDQDSPQALRYQLQCLFLRRQEARSGPFFHVCQKLNRTIADLCFDSLLYSITIHSDLFILRHPVHISRTCNLETEEGGLLKVVELIQGMGLEAGVQKAAWTQLAFLLEDPNLHKSFLRLCSLPFLVQTFLNMLRRGQSENVSVECVPRVVESLRLLATHSEEVRFSLLQHSTFLLALVGATLIFYEDTRMRSQAACLMALVLFQDIIGFSDGAKAGVAQLPSVPQLLAEGLHLPFIHQTRPWVEDTGLCGEMRTVHHLIKEGVWPVQEFLGSVWGASQAGGMEWLSSQHCLNSKDSGSLLLSERNIGWLKLSTMALATASALRNVENATSHHSVMRNVAALSFRVQQMGLTGGWDEGFFTTPTWRRSFQRFLTAEPNSLVDEQLLVHVLQCLCICLKAHSPGLKQHQDTCPPLIKFLVTELTSPSTALLQTLSKTGGTSWVACDYSVQTVQSVKLFRAAAGLVSCTLSVLADCSAGSKVTGENLWDTLAAAVTTTLLPILTANNDLQHYNLAVVGMALEVIQEASGEDSLSWLVSLWVYRDPLVASCGLNVAAAMAGHTSLLHCGLTQVSGGVWAAALSYFLPEGRSCLVRASAALLLMQLMQTSPSPSSPWPSPVVADVCTGESVDGLEGLVALLQHCNFYSLVLTSLSHLNEGLGQARPPPPTQEWDLSLSCLSSYSAVDREWEKGHQDLTSIQLYEATLKLLVNLVLLGSSHVVPQLFSHGLVTLVVTQLRYLLTNIKSSQSYLRAAEVSLVLLRAVLRDEPAQAATIARDTGLEHLALGVLAADLLPLTSLEVLAALLAGGGWGAVRVVEWVAACPSSILCPVVAALHGSTPSCLQTAASF